MMLNAAHVAAFLENWAPLPGQASYDNSGFQCGNPLAPVTGMLTCLDFTSGVLSEAIESGCNLVVAHHPVIFRKLSSVTSATPSGRLLIDTLNAGVTVYALHTPADFARNGVSFTLASQLDLRHAEFLSPSATGITGSGVLGELDEAMSPHDFLAFISTRLDQPQLRYSGNAPYIKKVAVCGGSGADLIEAATAAGAQAFVTADVKYHQFFVDQPDFLLVDCGHFESEIAFAAQLASLLSLAFPDVTVHTTRVYTNPVRYFSNRSEYTTV